MKGRFPNDPMLQELHDIGRKIYEEEKGLSIEERVERTHEKAKKAAASMGYKLVKIRDGVHKMVKIDKPKRKKKVASGKK